MCCRLILLGLLISLPSRAGSPAGPPVGQPPEAAVEARLVLAYLPRSVPAFRAAELSSWTGGLDLAWQPHEQVGLGLRTGVRSDRDSLGNALTGVDATTFWSRFRPLPASLLPVDLELAWAATLPWSFDGGQVGTDETDSQFFLDVGRQQGALRLDLAAGLAIRGNPLRFADQDDVPVGWAMARYGPPDWPLLVHLRAGGDLATARNPARTQLVVGLESACPLRAGIEGGPGLSIASPDWSVQAWLGWSAACRAGSGD